MLKTNNTKEILEDNLLSIEDRRFRAEKEFVIICEDKKRVILELEGVEKEIELKKEVVQKNNEEIIKTNQQILDCQNILRSKTQEFNLFIQQSDIKKREINSEIEEKTQRKQDISLKITEFLKVYEDNKEKQIKEIKQFNERINILNDKIKELDIKQADILFKIEKHEKNLFILIKEVKTFEEQKLVLQNSIQDLQNIIENQKGLIENNRIIIEQQEVIKKEKDDKIMFLDATITKKQEEYKEIESRSFAILKKQDILDSKEEFIKSQYERAGIKWEE